MTRRQNDALADARARLSEGEFVAEAILTPKEAYADRAVRLAIESSDPRTFPAAQLAEEAGFDVRVEVQEWDNGEIFTTWSVRVPAELNRKLEALVWDGAEGEMEYTLTRSTRHPGWQLTSWTREGSPWGHRDLKDDASDSFDTGHAASGVPMSGLVQVIFRDGRVLVRRGAKRIAFNPATHVGGVETLKRRLMR